MAYIEGTGSPTYASTGAVSRGGGGGPRRGGRAKTYSNSRAGMARFGGSTTPTGGGGLNLGGGLLGGLASAYAAKKQAQIARENREWQEKQNTIAYERSLPWSSYGPAGNVEFDPETKKIMQTLAPEYQDLMDQWLGTSGMATTELQGMMGDPYAMEQQQFKRFEDLNRDAYARSRAQGEEAALARGMTGTESYYDKLAIEDAINQSRLGGQMQSMRTGMDYRNMLAAESQGFGQNAMNVAGMLNTQADLGSMVGARTKPGMNMAGLSLAGTNYADTKSGFWSGMQDQAGLYNSAGQMTQAPQQGWLSSLMGAGKQFFSFLR
jgi:hypothetical protein